tara:strand:+ start:1356 stop:1610 length:255 start_codon:yes stop_codon:yes gene_type:complete
MKKIKLNLLIKIFLIQIFIILASSTESFAYIGLGPLLPMIGTIVAYIFIGIISVFGIIIYPLRLIIKKLKNKKHEKKDIQNEKN